MELRDLEYIVAIAEEGAISKAADRLFMAQSSLSQFLQRYEADLNAKLFVRTGSGVRPTVAGELLITNAKQMLQQYSRVKSELQDAAQPMGGRISFGISSFRGSALIPPVLRQFRAEYPTITVHISEHNTNILKKKIAAGELDMALIALQEGEVVGSDDVILKDEVVLVVNRDHPVMQHAHYRYPLRPWIDLRDAAPYEFLLSNTTTVLGRVAEEQFARCGFTPVTYNTNLTAAFASEMAKSGLGLAFSYGSCCHRQKDVEYFSIGEAGVNVSLVLTFPPNGYISRPNRVFAEKIRQFYRGAEAPWATP